MTDRVPFEVEVGAARAGWLGFLFAYGPHRLAPVASGVLNDPLDELGAAAVALLEPGPVDAAVRFWLEPDWEVLRFIGSGDDAVRIQASGWAVPPLPRRTVAGAVVAALVRCRRGLPVHGGLEGWGRFPDAHLRRALQSIQQDEAVRDFRRPWQAAGADARVLAEARAEIGAHHPLHGVDLVLRAANPDRDEYLFETGSACQPLAVVQLTWAGARARGVTSPATTLYPSWRAWAEACMPGEAREPL